MPQFEYKAKEGPEKIVSGVIDAPNRDQAVMKVIQLGFSPLDVFPFIARDPEKVKAKGHGFSSYRRVRLADQVLFTRQMSDLVNAKVPMLRALQIVSRQTRDQRFRDILMDIHAAVKDGGSFSDALKRHTDVFSPLYISLAKAGEVSGQLDLILKRLADHLEKENDVRGKIISSLLYPSVIFGMGVLVVVVLLTFVIPRLSVIFEEFDQRLPLPTVILMSVSHIVSRYWIVILGLTVLAIFYIQHWLKTASGKRSAHELILRIPLVGEFIRLVEVERFSRTMGTLLESGIVITTALASVEQTIGNTVFREQVEKITEAVSQGSSLRSALTQSPFFPEMAVNMISVGEETGRLEQSLTQVANSYERRTAQMSETILKLFGMGVLLLIVAFVGFVVACMLLPLLSLNLTI